MAEALQNSEGSYIGPGGVEQPGSKRNGGCAADIYAARALRDFGDGFAAVLLPVYLASIGLGPLKIGVVAIDPL
ncbi:hypothetical protein FJW05_11975 [Mesorhizobium sp. B2-9-1]|uniref:hypothetical protein n=1 Tax=Mesorhizobium sp. B2-9-1 TaxID=2589898 RepID=UPI001129913C|nr:hypothetical protein [Mesorhizobium sp. B2-9-1]TPI47668.1 hypothetical protein FJW05_11975 [Mesorhizobium sp. B2-9-1]